jgi:hypothetical protein
MAKKMRNSENNKLQHMKLNTITRQPERSNLLVTVDKSQDLHYICINSTRHASRQISVPGRVFYFTGYAVQ